MNLIVLKRARLGAGFTLVELLVVIAIIGVLAAVGVPAFNGYQATAKVNASKANFANAKQFIAAETVKCQNSSGTGVLTTVGTLASPACPLGTAAAYVAWFQQYYAQTASGINNPYVSNQLAYNTAVASTKGAIGISVSGTSIQLQVNTGENNANTLITTTIPVE